MSFEQNTQQFSEVRYTRSCLMLTVFRDLENVVFDVQL